MKREIHSVSRFCETGNRVVFLLYFLALAFDSTQAGLEPNLSLGEASASFVGDMGGGWAGWSISGTGDVNGDGYDDFIIGAKENSYAHGTAGQVYLIFGKASGWTKRTDLSGAGASFLGEDAVDRAGFSVAGVGDVNGDGLNDFVIGAPDDDDNGSSAGQVYLILGRRDGWAMRTDLSQADASFVGESGGDVAGFSTAGVGDCNGDGYDDFIIGAPWHSGGKVYVVFGKPDGWAMRSQLSEADAAFVAESGGDAGWYIGGAGDVNGDGLGDFLIGAPKKGPDVVGKAYLVFGKTSGWAAETSLANADASFIGENSREQVGFSVEGVGDANGDGLDDFLIGAPGDRDIGSSADGSYLFFGKTSGWITNTGVSAADASFHGESNNDESGWSVGGAGDVNGDGYGDLLIGAFRCDQGYTDAGKSYLIFGRQEGWHRGTSLSDSDASYLGEGSYNSSGWRVNGVGDINGDGFADFGVGAHTRYGGIGEVYLVFGESASLTPLPTRTPTSTPTSTFTRTPTITPTPTNSPTPVNAPPSRPIVAIVPENPLALDDLTCLASGSVDPEGEPVTYHFAWFRDGEPVGDETDFLSHTHTSRGNLIECLVTPDDGAVEGPSGSDSVTIGNTPPTAPVVLILPERPTPDDDLIGYIEQESVDADGDLVLYLYEWFESSDGTNWLRRPELSGNLGNPFQQGQPQALKHFIQMAEFWRIDVTPVDFPNPKSFEEWKNGGTSLDKDALSTGEKGSYVTRIVPDLDGDNVVGPQDLLFLRSVWNRTKSELDEDSQEIFFERNEPGSKQVGFRHLLNLAVGGWHEGVAATAAD